MATQLAASFLCSNKNYLLYNIPISIYETTKDVYSKEAHIALDLIKAERYLFCICTKMVFNGLLLILEF